MLKFKTRMSWTVSSVPIKRTRTKLQTYIIEILMNLNYVEKSIEGTKLRGKLCEIAVLSKITCLLETSSHMSR